VKYRKLRIGWSVAWGVVAVLIGLLWVRSYSWWDNVEWPAMHTHSVYLVSLQGRFGVGVGSVDPQFVVSGFTSDEITDAVEMLPAFHNSPPSFSFDVAGDRLDIVFPHWFGVIFCGALSVVPWLPYRFSLRTLLIATTLVAVALGLIVWAGR
jgi:hypothetical protein